MRSRVSMVIRLPSRRRCTSLPSLTARRPKVDSAMSAWRQNSEIWVRIWSFFIRNSFNAAFGMPGWAVALLCDLLPAFAHSTKPFRCRPREGGDPHAAAGLIGTTGGAFRCNMILWLWVPACAGRRVLPSLRGHTAAFPPFANAGFAQGIPPLEKSKGAGNAGRRMRPQPRTQKEKAYEL